MWTEYSKGITVRPLRNSDHHALVALVGGVEVGIGRLMRDGARAEITVAVADGWRHRGVGAVLADRLVADARAAGLTVSHTVARGTRPYELVFDTVRRWNPARPSNVSKTTAGRCERQLEGR
ncbi:MAG: hypothetical protein H0X39_11895 [Actinobacteria bacterium]|nr:hypothetical protein [Actinomycetota bacterium]